MTASPSETASASIEIENVGGIDHYELTVDPGITLLAGENATNRTSILQAIMAACGSDRATLNAGSEEGSVRLTLGSDTYHRQLSRTQAGEVAFDGRPLLEDTTSADLFSFLLADNRTRQAVIAEADLREIVMEPVDVESLEAEIDELQTELDAVEQQLDRRSTLQNERLPELKRRREELQAELERTNEDLQDARADLEAADNDLSESRSKQEEIESVLSSLQQAREQYNSIDAEIKTEKQALSTARKTAERAESELEDISLPDADRDELKQRQQELWDEKEAIQEQIEQLQTLIDFNRELLSEGTSTFQAIDAVIGDGTDETDRAEQLTNQLTGSENGSITCWTCGQPTSREEVTETISGLEQYRQTLYDERNNIEERIEQVESDVDALDEKRSRKEELAERKRQAEQEIQRAERTIESLADQKSELEETIADREAELDSLETDEGYQTVIDLHKKVNEIEVEKTSLETDLREVEDEIETVEGEIDDLSTLEETKAEIQEEIRERRTRIDRLETETVETFNDHMDALVEELDFENIERIWIEQKTETRTEGRRKVERSVFDLHVVRSQRDGTVFEDTIRNLSESERNVVGLVFALAGDLAHEVYADMPFMLLDSVEMIDATRKAKLFEYFSQYHSHLIAVVLADEVDPILQSLDPDSIIEVGAETSGVAP